MVTERIASPKVVTMSNPNSNFGTQALEALALHRMLERGELTQEQYSERLEAVSEGDDLPEKPVPAAVPGTQNEPGHHKDLDPALETAALPRRPQSGGPEQRLECFNGTPESMYERADTPYIMKAPATLPSGLDMPAPQPMRRNAYPISDHTNPSVSELSKPERFMVFKCPRCGEALNIYDRMSQLECGQCEAEIIVERKDCTIAVRLAEERSVHENPAAAATDLDTPAATVELRQLAHEAHRLRIWKTGMGLLGGCSGLAFACVGFIMAAAREFAMGTTALVGTGVSLLFVVLTCRDMNAAAHGLYFGRRDSALKAGIYPKKGGAVG